MFLNKGIYITFLCLVFVCSISAQTDFESGLVSYQQRNYENARDRFIKAIENDKENHDVLRYLGMTYARLGIDDLAVQTLNEADQINKQTHADDKIFGRAKALSKPGIIFSDVPRKDKLQGSMKAVAEINKNGAVTFVYPYQELNEVMTESAVKFTYKIKFQSAAINGSKISILKVIQYELSFI